MNASITELLATKKWIYYVGHDTFEEGKGYRVSIIFAETPGHFPTGGGDKEPWYWGNTLKEADSICEKKNLERGINKSQALDILGSSMFGINI